MSIAKRGLLIAGAVTAAVGYVWVAGVRAVPGAKQRRAASRDARRRAATRPE